MSVEARRRFREKSLDTALHAFHARFANSHDATTTLLPEEVRAQTRPGAEIYFRRAVYGKWVAAAPMAPTQ